MYIQIRLKNGKQDPILKGLVKTFQSKMTNLFHKRQPVVVMAKQRQLELIKKVQEGVGQSTHSKAMASHEGRYSTYLKISERSFWY